MKYVDEFRDRDRVLRTAEEIGRTVTRPWSVMEVCGGQTHAIVQHGLDSLLPPEVTLIHGPGCPVCVTPVEILDEAHALAARDGVILCTFADMLRVPGSRGDLFGVKARGGDVRTIRSPLDAVTIAAENPDREVVLLAIGFETTAPANALAVAEADRRGLENFSVLVSHVLVPPALRALLTAPDNRVEGFLAAGHVCTVMGWEEYRPIAERHRVPIVVTGFEPLDILQGLAMLLGQLEAGRHEVENQYARAATREGNRPAKELIRRVFKIADRTWRGMGPIAASGLALADAYRHLDARDRFGLPGSGVAIEEEGGPCRSGEVLRGRLRPNECPSFGNACTPEHPLGATMVSGEGACAAYYRYRAPLSRAEERP